MGQIIKKPQIEELGGKIEGSISRIADDTLRYVFKDIGVTLIYNYMKTKFELSKKDIGRRPHAFSTALEGLLGSATQMVETLILKRVYREFNQVFTEKKGYLFTDYIEELRR